MKLNYSPTSPYVRKVMVVAHETGVVERVELERTTASPVAVEQAITATNPLGKVPALVTDAGEALYDSRVVCEYLDSLHSRRKMFPGRGERRFRALARQALGDGILDAAILSRYETAVRPEQFRWPDWVAGQKRKIQRGLDACEAQADSLAGTVDIGTITIGCALGYLDFRFSHEPWRNGRPKLAAWYEKFARRRAMKATAPSE